MTGKLRPIAVALLKCGSKLLAMKGYDKVKDEVFYRLLGGGIEFGETSAETIKREFMEELGLDVEVQERLDVEENLFTFEGKLGHEIVFLYNAKFKDEALYEKTDFEFLEEGATIETVGWVEISDDVLIYPEIVKKYL
ncbi:MAG: NUDIX domain-containing protein [Alphaproteobacteria bacterium]|nr:NUDIX domain-containing protein [Alphaproteobacteria bacterium]